MSRTTYDASSTGGIKFWMKTDAPVTVGFLIPETTPPNSEGTCAPNAGDPNCNNHFSFQITAPTSDWTEYDVPFSALTQRTGGTATWNPQLLLGVQFQVGPGAAFEVWVDDVSFYYCPTTGCVPTCVDPVFPVACAAGATYPAACRPPGTTCTAAAGWCSDPLLIDDMEDGNSLICASGGRLGYWYTLGDGSAGTLSLAPGATFLMTPIPGGRDESRMAAHMTASGFTAGGAALRFGLSDPAAMSDTYDAHTTGGIKFWMKTDAPSVLVSIPTAETVTVANGGQCSDGASEVNCDNYFAFNIPPHPQ